MPVSASVAQARQSRYDRRLNRAAAMIPQGPYCYRIAGVTHPSDGSARVQTVRCPYWKTRLDWPDQADGYCRLLKKGDTSQGRNTDGRPRATMLLWDQVKECGINEDSDEDEPDQGCASGL